ncbi:hypothetical protein BB561_000808 [Smittium simulii]|uniref:Uncharacterized protein n=1 Tax=Smittium simulii TaxID=133385 RepID=A0A2T9YXI6_9FUNG|nr:hypothetical protein BB561_000808 [Smittium simulii]
MKILESAANEDREGCVYWSEKIGYLTGFESDAMKQAHVDSIMTIGEPFRVKGPYSFAMQKVTKKVKSNIAVMLNERLTPPPNETYSLHRKLSGVFLLCSKLSANVECSKLYKKYLDNYDFSSL